MAQDIIDASGLQVKTLPELVEELDTAFTTIYAPDVNVAQNSPDGQMLNIYAQGGEDIRELALQVNAGFDPDQAVGAILDQRVAINNLQRQGGSYTIVGITVTATQTVELQGLDAAFNNINGTGFTAADNAGNNYILVDTTVVTAGDTTLNFRAQKIGAVDPVVNTIINQVTIIAGISAVNNASAPLILGQNQETDSQLRIRRQQSVALAAFGYLDGLQGSLLSLTGVTAAKVYENVGSTTDGDGIPGHGIWAIVEGGANTDIANMIYSKKSYGANMKGSVTIPITTPSGAVFNAKFDRPTAAPLYIRFNIQKTVSTATFDQDGIKDYIVSNKTFTIGEYAETASLTAVAQAAISATGGGGVPVDLEISSNGSVWVDYLPTATLDKEWTLSQTNIAITVL